MAQATLLDISKLNGSDETVGLIEENLTYTPDVAALPARTIRGTSYKIAVRTDYPGVGFRMANGGVTYGKSTFQNRMVECFILSGNVRADVAVASAYEDGTEAFKAIEASGVMKQALIELGQQLYYGTSVDSLGFPGFQAIHAAYAASMTAPITVDATGTSANAATSVYGVKFGPQDVQLIFGENKSLELGDWFLQMVNDGTAGQDYLAWVASLNAWVGLQVGSIYSVGRIKNLTAETGKGLTDTLIATLLSKYPVGHRPDALFMNRQSLLQLQISRNPAVAYVGQVIAPMPTESNGIPIIVTDSIVNTEAIA